MILGVNWEDEPEETRRELAATIGGLIRRLREHKGISQESLARRANIAMGVVARVERGDSLPSLLSYQAILGALGIRWEAADPLRTALARRRIRERP